LFYDVDVEAFLWAEAAKLSDVSGSLISEVEVWAFDQDGGLDSIDEESVDEVFGGEAKEFWCGFQDDEGIDAEQGQEVRFQFERCEDPRGFLWMQQCDGMRLEGHCGQVCVIFEGLAFCGFEDLAVAEVDAVEISDGQDGAFL